MRPLRFKPWASEDEQFVSLVRNLINGVVFTTRPKVYCVVRVNNWFSDRWLNFTGKVLGGVGIRKRSRTTFPPFVPNRLHGYAMFEWSDEKNDYVHIEHPHLVHRWQRSIDNFQNFVDHSYSNSAFFWFSGNTKANRRGSVMGYVTESDSEGAKYRDIRWREQGPTWAWYLEFSKEAGWKHTKAINITPEQVQFFVEKCECPVEA